MPLAISLKLGPAAGELAARPCDRGRGRRTRSAGADLQAHHKASWSDGSRKGGETSTFTLEPRPVEVARVRLYCAGLAPDLVPSPRARWMTPAPLAVLTWKIIKGWSTSAAQAMARPIASISPSRGCEGT